MICSTVNAEPMKQYEPQRQKCWQIKVNGRIHTFERGSSKQLLVGKYLYVERDGYINVYDQTSNEIVRRIKFTDDYKMREPQIISRVEQDKKHALPMLLNKK